ncbi:MAG: hypothetical protein IPF53_06260 [Blastocatellia bacterium]|jgi:hypothetical protein|nr:hypothetical protein [Blastocatellia bacterium]MBK6424739.1 hypothetical protein [Blastocatellia bacterium]
MNRKSILTVIAAVVILSAGFAVGAQVSRPYHNGSVWGIGQIRVKPGMGEAYKTYLATEWKTNQEAMKKEGIILSYKVISTEAHGTQDFNMLLMTEYKDLATYEANQDKADALAQRIVGDDKKQEQGYRDRSEMREVLGNRLGREIVLAPK